MSDKKHPNTSDSVLVMGLGRLGTAVARRLLEQGTEVLAIDNDPAIVQSLSSDLPHVVHADSTDMNVLRQLGVLDFSHVVGSIGSNLEASILTILNLNQLGVKDIWARAKDTQHGRIAEGVGAYHVVYLEAETGGRVAHLVTGKMIDFIEFDDSFAIAKTRSPRQTHGKTLAQSDVRKKYGITVVGIKRRHQDFIYAKAETEIKAGDHLMVAGETRLVDRFAALY